MIPTVDNEYLSITAYHQGTYMFSYDFQNHQYSFVMCFQFSKEVYSLWHLFICFFSTDSFNRHLFSISMSQTQPLPSWSSSRENRYVNTQLLYKVLNSCHENCSGHTVGTKECDRSSSVKPKELTGEIYAYFHSKWLTLNVFMRLSHFSKECCSKPVLCQNVMKELTLASARLGVYLFSYLL